MSKASSYLEKVKTTTGTPEAYELWTEIKQLKESDGTPKEFVDLICACLTNPRLNILRSAGTIVKLIKWKGFQDGIAQIVDQLMIKPDTSFLDETASNWRSDEYSALEGFADSMKDISSKTNKLNEYLATRWCKLVIATMNNTHRWYTTVVYKVAGTCDKFELVNVSLKEEFLKTFLKYINEHPDPNWYKETNTSVLASYPFSQTVISLKTDQQHKNCIDLLFQIYEFVHTMEFTDESESWTFFGTVILHIMVQLYSKIVTKQWDFNYLKPFLPLIMKWFDKNEDDCSTFETEYVKQRCYDIMVFLLDNHPDVLRESDIEKFCKLSIEKKEYNILNGLKSCYENAGDKPKKIIEKYTNQFIDIFTQTGVTALLSLIFKANPQMINGETIDKVESELDDQTNSLTSMMFLRDMVMLNRNAFKGRGNSYFMSARKFNNEYYSHTITISYVLQQIFFIDKENAERVANLWESEMKLLAGQTTTLSTFFGYMYAMASNNPEVFRKRIPFLESYKDTPQLKTYAQGIIDIVEGRSLKKVSDDVEQHDKDIQNLDKEVGKTKNDVIKLDRRVDQHDDDIKENRDNIASTQNDVNHLGERVDLAEDKIEDIDNKTVSNAPAWSKEVSKLMNPKANNDWTLIAQRLNYSPSDIRGWATQPDPTMSMLAEFYTSNKTSEATKYLVKVLNDANRPDAVAIIEKYQKQSDSVIKDDDSGYKAPPTVFISYQWGVQTQVKLLKDYIEKEGYTCWMDLGQMGGGDMLYEKINDGIRSAKIVILCMTELYCKSANCIREVNLANGLDKLIVPLMIDKDLQWPPPGSMGPILAGKLFIRFFQRNNEQTNDERYWPPDKYEELMEKIRGSAGTPSSAVVKEANFRGNAVPSQQKSYKVCISCSPDKEPVMKTLQRDLQAAGYETKVCSYVEDSLANCQAEVYICCLCLRYSKSSLAVTEIEAAQSKNKPIIVLMFDSRSDYPPMGPLKKHLAQLTPINCAYNNPTAGSNQFQDIVDLIQSYLNGKQPNHKQNSNSRNTPTKSSYIRSNSNDRGKPEKSRDTSGYSSDSSKLTGRNLNQRAKLPENSLRNKPLNYPKKPPDDEPGYNNPDAPKLPSLYRQRLNSRY